MNLVVLAGPLVFLVVLIVLIVELVKAALDR